MADTIRRNWVILQLAMANQAKLVALDAHESYIHDSQEERP
jgi:hypothetical protein